MKTRIEEMVEEVVEYVETLLNKEGQLLTEDAEDWLTQTLQTERQRCEEMVEAEAEAAYKAGQSDLIYYINQIADGDTELLFTEQIELEARRLQSLTQPTPLTNRRCVEENSKS